MSIDETIKIEMATKRLSEPRYSVAELEKIAETCIDHGEFQGETRNPYGDSPAYIATDGSQEVKHFIELLKDRKKVEAIL